MTNTIQPLSGWNHYPIQPCKIIRPERYRELQAQPSCIARGQGRSYGDAALNTKGAVLLTERLNRLLAFDKHAGILQAEAGITLAEILAVIVPHGWFLSVTPGTQFTSLGGCIAADVHGKNHHHAGSFGNFILNFELILAGNTRLICSPTENADAFWATIGGMGLTGIIGTATIKLMPLPSTQMAVKSIAAANLEQIFTLLADPVYDDTYTVAWIDTLATGSNLGKGIIMTAHHLPAGESITTVKTFNRKLTIPTICPDGLLNKYTSKLFNAFYYRQQLRNTITIVNYPQYFYPLDSIAHWNRLYGKKGFVQYQCVIPEQHSFVAIKALLEKLTQAGYPSFLGVLKRFGASNPGLLSFPMSGYTLALDIPLKDQALFHLLDALDAIVLQYAGRVYLAKDARLKPDIFRAMYPNYPHWLKQKQLLDPENHFTSSLAERLQIGY